MAIALASSPQISGSKFNGLGGNNVFDFNVSGADISEERYRIEIRIRNANASVVLAGAFDYYKKVSANEVSANISEILKTLIDINGGVQSLQYRLQYSEAWIDEEEGSTATIADTFVAIFGYAPSNYTGYICEGGLTNQKSLNKIKRIWPNYPFSISFLSGDNGADNITTKIELFGSDGSTPFQLKSITNTIDQSLLNITFSILVADVGNLVNDSFPNTFAGNLNGWDVFDNPDEGTDTAFTYRSANDGSIRLSSTQSNESEIRGQDFVVALGQSFSIYTRSVISTLYTVGGNPCNIKIWGRKTSDSSWMILETFPDLLFQSISLQDHVLEINNVANDLDKIGFTVTPVGGGIYRGYFITNFSTNLLFEGAKSAKTTYIIDSAAVITEDFNIEPCSDGIMLRWINSLGGIEQFLFNSPFDKSYNFDNGGNKYLRQRLFAEGLTKTEWDAMNDLNKEGEIYENSEGIRYRQNHQVWQVATNGDFTPVIVLNSSQITRSNTPKTSFEVQIEYPKEKIT